MLVRVTVSEALVAGVGNRAARVSSVAIFWFLTTIIGGIKPSYMTVVESTAEISQTVGIKVAVTFVLTALVVERAAIVSTMATYPSCSFQRVKAAIISLVEPTVNILVAVVSPTLELSLAVGVVVAVSLSFTAFVEKRTAGVASVTLSFNKLTPGNLTTKPNCQG